MADMMAQGRSVRMDGLGTFRYTINTEKKGGDGYLSMEYDRIAYAAVISLAKETESIEERVTRLESENVELKAKIEEYERLNRQRTIRTDISDVVIDS